MTYSIGFRAPSRRELIAHWADDLVAELGEDDRYADLGLALQDNPGEIDATAIDRLHAMVTEKLQDRAAFARWFGRYNSEPKNPDVDWRPEVPVDAAALLAGGAALVRNPASRFSFVRQGADAVVLFVDGEAFDCSGAARAFAERLCAQDRIAVEQAPGPEVVSLITRLIDQGSVAFDD